MEICKKDYFNLSANAVLAAAGTSQIFVPLQYEDYAYINRISGYNGAANSYNGVLGIIDEQNNQTPITITACAQYAAFNTQVDKVIRPEFGAYWAVTASSYPVTAQMMIDGYFFTLE
jgi:hypothetical protein